MRVLGIETSCDETGIAIYDSAEGLLAHEIFSQTTHEQYGGVVPELASRDHVRKVLPLIQSVLEKAALQSQDIDGIAFTKGPGLAGALMVGALIAQGLGLAWNVPVIGVHHLEGHLLAPMLEPNPPPFPFIALLVSGGHTQLIHVKAEGQYELLGESVDDAAGEAFDKTAKLLGLPYPGGALLAALATEGDATQFHFPRPLLRQGLQFSFSGLKTAVAQTIAKSNIADPTVKANIAAAFEEAVVETLCVKSLRALAQTGVQRLVIAGGVSANIKLRETLAQKGIIDGFEVYYPRIAFCTDNGAMIAYAGCRRLLRGESDQDMTIKARWPITELQVIV